MAEQPRHAVADAVGVFETFAKHHVAAALPVHWARRGEMRKPGPEPIGGGKPSGVELWIAAGKPTTVAVLWRGHVGERREGHYLGARALPAVEDMRVDEAEGLVLRERDAPARRRDRRV